MPPTQLFGASHGYGKTVGSVQQIWPRAPQGVQLPLSHVSPVVHVVPPQHASPDVPQPSHEPAAQVAPP